MDRISNKPLRLISHRGLNREFTENSRAAFCAARDKGFQALETDLRVTLDGHLVLAHDPQLTGADGRSLIIAQSQRSQLENFLLVGHEPPLFFDQFALQFRDLSWTLDFKPEDCKRTITAVKALAVRLPWLRDKFHQDTRFLFWRAGDEWEFKEYFPGCRFYARSDECRRVGLMMLLRLGPLAGPDQNKIYSLPASFMGISCYSEDLVRRFHRQGCSVLAFLPGSMENFLRAKQAGFDEILCDEWYES